MIQHLERVARLPVPDFGPLADWAAIRSAELRHRQHRARHGVQRDADGRLDDEFADETAVHVDMEGAWLQQDSRWCCCVVVLNEAASRSEGAIPNPLPMC